MTMTKTLFPRLLATVVAVALSLVWGASMAQAQTISPTPPPEEGRTGLVTVTALANAETIPTPVVGATFELYPVQGIDVHDEADWDRIRDWFAAPSGVIETLDLGEPTKIGPTSDKGRAEPVEVPVGLYVLKQTSDDEVVFNDALFTVPTLGFEDEWVYDLLVYPKVDCGCEPTPSPTPTPEPSPTATPADPGKPAPRPGVPTGELFADSAQWGLLALAGALAVGAVVVATRRSRDARETRS